MKKALIHWGISLLALITVSVAAAGPNDHPPTSQPMSPPIATLSHHT